MGTTSFRKKSSTALFTHANWHLLGLLLIGLPLLRWRQFRIDAEARYGPVAKRGGWQLPRAGPALVVDVECDGRDQDEALDHLLRW